MKKIIISSLFALAAMSAFAQAKKFPLVLHFTNTKCSVCGSNNPAFYTLLDAFPKDVHHIAVHPSFPYSSCALYQANTTDNTLLALKYGAGSTPTYSVNGATPTSVSNLNNTQLKTLTSDKSPIQVKVSENKGTARTIKVTVKTVGTVPAANYIMYAAVCEKSLNLATSNGEKVHRDVLRKIISAGSGDAFAPAALNQERVANFTFNVDPAWKESEIYTLVWIQDGNNNVLNSGTAADVTSATEDLLVDETVKVFPTPFNQQLNVDLSQLNATPKEIFIQNMEGKVVARFEAKKELNVLTINNLSAGEYVVKVSTDKGVLAYKSIKL
jgi:Secretion system C-terminal sorting domain/Outer membrane protein Omp28